MKVIKAKVYYKKIDNRTTYSGGYPKCWQAEKIPLVLYADTGTESDGRTFQNVLAIVPNDLYEVMIKDNNCFPVSKEEAIAIGNQYRPQVDKVVDMDKVLKILAKSARGEKLSVEETNALDPNHPEIGINKSASFEEICNRFNVEW